MHVMNTRMSDILLPDRRAYLRETGASLSTTSNLFRAQSLAVSVCGRGWFVFIAILRVKLCKKKQSACVYRNLMKDKADTREKKQ